MTNRQAPVIIDGLKVTSKAKCWQICRTVNNGSKLVIQTTGKTPEETFKKFVAKCEAKGVNYKTDFAPLGSPRASSKKPPTTTVNLEAKAVTPVVTPVVTPIVTPVVTPVVTTVVTPVVTPVVKQKMTIKMYQEETMKLQMDLMTATIEGDFEEMERIVSALVNFPMF